MTRHFPPPFRRSLDEDCRNCIGRRRSRCVEHGARPVRCAACHSNDKQVVGPAYVEVAAKYKGDAGAAAKLMEKVKKGGQGVWGPVPMPPNPSVSDADLKTIVTYILALKK